jgi:hypothetical protein
VEIKYAMRPLGVYIFMAHIDFGRGSAARVFRAADKDKD